MIASPLDGISVLIPTYKRPEMLREALYSVQWQSRRDVIKEVIVSENSDDPRSETIVAEFKDLPIRFIRRNPALKPEAHFHSVVSDASYPWVCLLGDDDMWGRYHVEELLRLKAEHPSAVTCINQCVVMHKGSRHPTKGLMSTLHALAHQFSSSPKSSWLMTPKEMIAESLLFTPLNMWSMLSPKKVVLKAMDFMVQDPDHGLDADRLIIWRMALQGDVAVGQEIGLFYRKHSDNACTRMAKDRLSFHTMMQAKYSTYIIQEAEALGISPFEEWSKLWERLQPHEKRYAWAHCLPGARDEFVKRYGQPSDTPAAIQNQYLRKSFNFLKSCIPPVLTMPIKRILGHNM